MRIEVTAEDIEQGKRMEPCKCPIALAITKLVPSTTDVSVGTGKVRLTPIKGDYHIHLLPRVAEQFISDFDNLRPVAPFCFYLPDSAFDVR